VCRVSLAVTEEIPLEIGSQCHSASRDWSETRNSPCPKLNEGRLSSRVPNWACPVHFEYHSKVVCLFRDYPGDPPDLSCFSSYVKVADMPCDYPESSWMFQQFVKVKVKVVECSLLLASANPQPINTYQYLSRPPLSFNRVSMKSRKRASRFVFFHRMLTTCLP
jgi:hypothetical protein